MKLVLVSVTPGIASNCQELQDVKIASCCKERKLASAGTDPGILKGGGGGGEGGGPAEFPQKGGPTTYSSHLYWALDPPPPPPPPPSRGSALICLVLSACLIDYDSPLGYMHNTENI